MTYRDQLFREPHWLSNPQITLDKGRAIEVLPGVQGSELGRLEEEIVRELLKRRKMAGKGKRTSDGLTAMEWLRATLYGVILAWLHYENGDELYERIGSARRYARGKKGQDATVFHDGIVAVLAKNPQVITPTERARMAQPMWHAFRHYIPPALLLGFNHQYPAHRRQNASELGQIHHMLTGWVVEQRTLSRVRDCPLDAFRETYPDTVEHVVDARVAETLDVLDIARRTAATRTVDSDEWDAEWPD
jgi:hypothetical protein